MVRANAKKHKPPSQIGGTAVKPVGKPTRLPDGYWQTIVSVSDAEDDARVWEFNVTTGRLIQTQS